MTCAVKQCPLGQAWFDEALTPSVAHQRVECSNMGTCDRRSGTCTCRWGFTGLAWYTDNMTNSIHTEYTQSDIPFF